MSNTPNVIILNAGFGRRFGGNIPKCLLKLNGETIIDRQLRLLHSREIHKITIAVYGKNGRMNDKMKRLAETQRTLIEEHLKGKKVETRRVSCWYLPTPKVVWTLFHCRDLFSNTIVLLGDVIFSKETLDEILYQPIDDLMFVGVGNIKSRFTGRYGELYMLLMNATGAKILKEIPNPFPKTHPVHLWEHSALRRFRGVFSSKVFTPSGYIQDVDGRKDLHIARKILGSMNYEA